MMSTLHKILSYLEKPKPPTPKEHHIFGDVDLNFKTMEKYEEFKRECGIPKSEDMYGDESTSKETWKTCEGIVDGIEIDARSPLYPNSKYDPVAVEKLHSERQKETEKKNENFFQNMLERGKFRPLRFVYTIEELKAVYESEGYTEIKVQSFGVNGYSVTAKEPEGKLYGLYFHQMYDVSPNVKGIAVGFVRDVK